MRERCVLVLAGCGQLGSCVAAVGVVLELEAFHRCVVDAVALFDCGFYCVFCVFVLLVLSGSSVFAGFSRMLFTYLGALFSKRLDLLLLISGYNFPLDQTL